VQLFITSTDSVDSFEVGDAFIGFHESGCQVPVGFHKRESSIMLCR
jgi:hypothetical protein